MSVAASSRRRALLVITSGLALGVSACSETPGTGSFIPNLPPFIHSVSAHPDSIGQADSTSVVIEASDPNHDILVYDWETDSRLKIRGALPNEYFRYNTFSNSQIFYAGPGHGQPLDTAWIWCTARDRRGMSNSKLIHVVVHH